MTVLPKGVIEERYIRRNSTEPYELSISKGLVAGHTGINKFGYREVTAHATNYYTISSAGANYVFPTAATTAAVSSSNTGEDNGGTVVVEGLDANWEEIEETITIGQTGSESFYRVNRVYMLEAGSGNDINEGNITVTVNAKTVAYIPSGYGQTMQAVYSVSAGSNAYILQIDVGVDEKEKPVHARIQTSDRTLTNPSWRTRAFVVMESNFIQHKPSVPIKVTEKTDIVLEGNSSAGTIEISGGFDIIESNGFDAGYN